MNSAPATIGAFTDTDLKRLKERLNDKEHDSLKDFWPLMHEYFCALLTRLEAAEALCQHIGTVPDQAPMGWYGDGLQLFDEWQKAAGK